VLQTPIKYRLPTENDPAMLGLVDWKYVSIILDVHTREKIGSHIVADVVFELPDGSPYFIDRDLTGEKRSHSQARTGPLEKLEAGPMGILIW